MYVLYTFFAYCTLMKSIVSYSKTKYITWWYFNFDVLSSHIRLYTIGAKEKRLYKIILVSFHVIFEKLIENAQISSFPEENSSEKQNQWYKKIKLINFKTIPSQIHRLSLITHHEKSQFHRWTER